MHPVSANAVCAGLLSAFNLQAGPIVFLQHSPCLLLVHAGVSSADCADQALGLRYSFAHTYHQPTARNRRSCRDHADNLLCVVLQVPAACQWHRPTALAAVSGQQCAAASIRRPAHHAAAARHHRVAAGVHTAVVIHQSSFCSTWVLAWRAGVVGRQSGVVSSRHSGRLGMFSSNPAS